jgi:monovalent cation:proton antiporter-2 (CPA2) family protein
MKESLLTNIFWQAGIFLVLAALIIPALRYFKVPIALGYLLAGIALGPYALGALTEQFPILDIISLQDAAHVKILAELGIVLLLFVIGLELTPRRLWQMRHLVFGLGGSQVLVSALVIGTIAYFWGNTAQVSVLLGLSLALSSTAIVIQWLHEKKLFATHTGRTSFSILLFQDLAVIPILLLLTIMSTKIEGPITQFVSLSLLKMVGTGLALYVIGKITLKPLFVFANKHGGAEVFMALSLLVIIVSASVAALAGLSMALGAFIAGLLLADTQYRHEITSLITPFKSMFIGIFFISFGMGINLHYIAEKPFWLITSVLGLMAIKASLIFILCKAWKQTTAVAAESAVLLAQAGEFGLLVVGSALTVGLMTEDIGQFMLIMIGITMMCTPLMAPLAQKIGKIIEAKEVKSDSPLHHDASESKEGHVVIFGYGRMGRAIADILCKEGIDILAFDKNVDHVHYGHAQGVPVYFGDASRTHTLSAANLEKAICAVIALDDIKATHRILDAIRQIDPKLPVVVRAQEEGDLAQFHKTDFVHAIPEHLHISEKISEKILEHCSHQQDKAYAGAQ